MSLTVYPATIVAAPIEVVWKPSTVFKSALCKRVQMDTMARHRGCKWGTNVLK